MLLILLPNFLYVVQRRAAEAVSRGDLTVTEAAVAFGIGKKVVTYWLKKATNPSFHPCSWGGPRNWKYTPLQHSLAESVLFELIEQKPQETAKEYATWMKKYGILDATESWVTRCIARWHFSIKKTYHVQKLKFTEENMLRYVDHIFGAVQLDPTKLKYLDESRFETRGPTTETNEVLTK